ncbi:hypothetical protein [Microcoleus sp. BROC3]|uniref:hypothetical protein n=1 Tax=Microcoleus sp. BROC3 TaxID=3055323 RepID=UPI002FCF0678
MASYREWNQALVSYFTSGVPRGTKLYVSVDDDVLERIGLEFGKDTGVNNGRDDFLIAVRKKVIIDQQVNLSNLRGCDSDGLPKSIAFLSATVLAAYQMAEEEKISELNYFRRLQKILGLSDARRPPGMESGSAAEEPLWKEWNLWLRQQGFLPSAVRGRGGPTTYINYPISQSLLRHADKNRLLDIFNEKQWTAQWDAQTLFTHVRRETPRLCQHLKELLTDNRQRYEAVAEAIHEVYEQWQNEGKPVTLKQGVRTWSRYLFAGLYRTEDPFLGQIDYYLYPKQLKGRPVESVQVQYRDNVHQLRDERAGWYFPLKDPINMNELDRGARYQISCSTDLDSLILPERNFWILIPDPDNPDSGAYASWGTPSLGTPFILLYKKELLSDIQRLQDEQLLKWQGGAQPVFKNSTWFEIHTCMVVSQAWDAVFIKSQELKDALQPSVRLSISFSGGLRVPQLGAWLEGHSPQVTIFGFHPTVELQVTRLSDDSQIWEKLQQSTNIPIVVNFPSVGDYLIKATCGGESSERFVRIVDWSSLSIEEPSSCEVMPIGSSHNICGSVLQSLAQ